MVFCYLCNKLLENQEMHYDSDFSQYIMGSDWDAVKAKNLGTYDSDTNLNHTFKLLLELKIVTSVSLLSS